MEIYLEMTFESRWYDTDTKVSLAVGCIEKADEKIRNKAAKIIIKNAMQLGVLAKRPFRGLFRRWYDQDKDLSLAMEYFKNCDYKQRHIVAEYVITFISSGLLVSSKK
jgi:hypothetical protein